MGHPVKRTKSLGLLKREKIEDKNLTELSFYQKLKFSNPYIFATQCRSL